MDQIWLYTICSVIIVSSMSLIGIFSLAFRKESFQKIIFILVAFAAGSLLGDVFIHLIPEISKDSGLTLGASLYILTGIIIFFVLEKIIHWRHCHTQNCTNHPSSMGTMNLFADALHNFIDGIVIAGSFLVNIPLGIATTVAVLLHEVPQEIGEFAILIQAGFSTKKALLFNFLSALTAVIGAIIILILGKGSENITSWIIPITAGGFIYIALSDLVPELHKEVKIEKSFMQLIFLGLGILLMVLLLKLG